jgi:hypothetical protein
MARFHAAIGMTIMLLVRSSRPWSTILPDGVISSRLPRADRADAHDEADGEHEAGEDLHEPGVARGEPGGAAANDLG